MQASTTIAACCAPFACLSCAANGYTAQQAVQAVLGAVIGACFATRPLVLLQSPSSETSGMLLAKKLASMQPGTLSLPGPAAALPLPMAATLTTAQAPTPAHVLSPGPARAAAAPVPQSTNTLLPAAAVSQATTPASSAAAAVSMGAAFTTKQMPPPAPRAAAALTSIGASEAHFRNSLGLLTAQAAAAQRQAPMPASGAPAANMRDAAMMAAMGSPLFRQAAEHHICSSNEPIAQRVLTNPLRLKPACTPTQLIASRLSFHRSTRLLTAALCAVNSPPCEVAYAQCRGNRLYHWV